MSWSRVIAFIRLGRPHFLLGGFLLFALGAAIARFLGHSIDAVRYALGQGAVTAFQLMTHYANDFFDLEADRANSTPTKFSGGSRVLPGGELAPEVALTAALVLAAIGVALTAVISVVVDPATARIAVPLLTATFFLSWGYSAPPARLCASGAGELDTALVVTGLVPLLGHAIQAGLVQLGVVVIAIVPLACLQFAMLLAIEVPDAEGDAATGKRTLVVRLGARRASWMHAGAIALAIVAVALMPAFGVPGRVALITLAVLAPLGGWQALRFHRAVRLPDRWERLALWAVVLLVGTSVAELGAFLYARTW